MHSTGLLRTRVNERLERAARFPVTLVVAPAGFGKSVALRDFIETARIQAVRYDVQREDGTLLAFVRRLSEALEPVTPAALPAFLAMQERILASEEPVRQLSDWFVEHLKNVNCTIVLDDLHFAAADAASIALIADVIERTGDRIKWIIAARSDIGLPIATWVAYGRMDIPIGEDDLRFTSDEALASAEQSAAQLDPLEIESLRALTEGWPVALTIALRTRTHATDLQTASFGTRDMIYRYLAEQIFAALSPQQRSFALATSVFANFGSAIAHELGATQDFIDAFRSRITFLNETAPGEYRYHDLFRDFLESELRKSGEDAWLSALCAGGEKLEARGDFAGALDLYTKARAAAPIASIIERAGFALFEQGEVAGLALALDALPDTLRAGSASALGLRAMIDASLGRFEIAERAFLSAIELARDNDDLRMRLVHRYAIELVRSEGNPVAFLEPFAFDGSIASRYRVGLLATLATGYLHAGRQAEALSAIEIAFSLADASLSSETQARLYQQAAYVERYAGSIERARAYANTAIDLAGANNLYELAARAYSVLYTVVRDTGDDPIASLAVLDKLSEAARKGASAQARLFALVASYDVEVERGDDAALEHIDRDMQENQAFLLRWRSTAVLPAHAMREAWNGDFARAFSLIEGTAREQTTNEQCALRAAEIALYASAAGLNAQADEALRDACAALESSDRSTKRAIRAHLLMAAAEIVRGRDASAHRYIAQAEHALSGNMPRLRALAHAIRTIYRVRLGQADEESRLAALERLRSVHFGGFARLLASLPLMAADGGYGSLTPAEREILQLLAKGASTKEIAARTGRSPHTVDTHIRSMCRKLSCNGRREAVALATSQGWVQA